MVSKGVLSKAPSMSMNTPRTERLTWSALSTWLTTSWRAVSTDLPACPVEQLSGLGSELSQLFVPPGHSFAISSCSEGTGRLVGLQNDLPQLLSSLIDRPLGSEVPYRFPEPAGQLRSVTVPVSGPWVPKGLGYLPGAIIPQRKFNDAVIRQGVLLTDPPNSDRLDYPLRAQR
ncbi:hypothetical protein PV326_008738 [Microctonus aethiopoides]|nr:hypothetical protein PV326_008738 [Microctonus aethiopoides]